MRWVFIQLFCLVGCSMAAAAVLDRVAVVVGDAVITEGEVLDELRLEAFVTPRPLDFSAASRRAAAERLVDQELIRQEMEIARYKGPDPKTADAMLRNFQNQHFHDQAEFHAALKRYGLTEDQLKQYLLWELTTIRFTDERFHPGVPQSEPKASRQAPASQPSRPPPHNRIPKAGPAPSGTQSADRLAPGAVASAPGATVDQQLDAWLKQARQSTEITFKPEAFQ